MTDRGGWHLHRRNALSSDSIANCCGSILDLERRALEVRPYAPRSGEPVRR